MFVSVVLMKMALPAIAPFLNLRISADIVRDTINPKDVALEHVHLVDLCDRLEASLTTTAATRRPLLDALLAEALAPASIEAQAAAAE
jgi:hypothetical protein